VVGQGTIGLGTMDDINEALKELWLKEDLGNNTLFIGNLLLDKM
jgi:hypothetical protein